MRLLEEDGSFRREKGRGSAIIRRKPRLPRHAAGVCKPSASPRLTRCTPETRHAQSQRSAGMKRRSTAEAARQRAAGLSPPRRCRHQRRSGGSARENSRRAGSRCSTRGAQERCAPRQCAAAPGARLFHTPFRERQRRIHPKVGFFARTPRSLTQPAAPRKGASPRLQQEEMFEIGGGAPGTEAAAW